MKILIKNKKWNMFIGNMVLICDVREKSGIFYIDFIYNHKKITLKSNNIDRTLRYLEELFLLKEKNNQTQKSA